jgi:hypothetical protein
MIRGLTDFAVLVGFTLMLPFFCAAAWWWGNADERILMTIAGCVLSPFTAVLWYVLLSHLILLHRRSSYLVQFFVFLCSATGIVMLIRSGVITF